MTVMLLVHIICMSVSIIATIGMVVVTVFHKSVPSWASVGNIAVTLGGLGAGTLLLLNHPLDLRCILLASYLVAFAASYGYMRRKRINPSFLTTQR